MMQRTITIFTVALWAASSWSQAPTRPATVRPHTASATVRSTPTSPALNITQLNSTLSALQNAAQQTTLDLARLRVDKWKTDGGSKEQIQANVQSLESNMTNALPGMIAAVRSSPTSLTANLKLYRDLNVLYDVLGPLADSAGAFGNRDEYQSLSADAQLLEANRRSIADYMEGLAAFQEAELSRLRGHGGISGSAATTPPASTRKAGPVVVMGENGVPKRIVDADDDDAPQRPVHKKSAPTTQPASQTTTKK
jgi:hypothetical protein